VSGPKPDDHEDKRRMKGQTEVKHEILEKYLQPWLNKITEIDSHIQYVDGFAGWGRYEDGSPGSPLIAMQVVSESLEEDVGRLNTKLDRFRCDFVEENDSNFADLKAAVEEELKDCPEEIKVEYHKTEFATFARKFIDTPPRDIHPTFIFIDPFGFGGVPFELVDRLINMRSSGMEIFITFMSGKMARFKDSDTHGVAIDEILGTDKWKEEIDDSLSRDKRAEEFVKLYEKQLLEEADVDYVWPFEMKKEDSRETNYYLVHATNQFDGIKLMKSVMFSAGAEDQFAYLGPDHYGYEDNQQSLSEFHDYEDEQLQRKIENLANKLHNRFEGQELTFWEVMKQTYEDTTLIEKHYRSACKLLAEQDRAEINNQPGKAEGTQRGLNNDDKVKFLIRSGLGDFIN
jgi:three-Cys-motif partner protein